MKKILFCAVSLILCFCACFAVGCSAAPKGDYAYGGDKAPGGDKKSEMAGTTGDTSGDPSAPGDTSADSSYKENLPQPGQLTAGAYNDNDYYGEWLKLFYKGQTEAKNGKFSDKTGYFNLYSLDRVKVTVKSGETPVEQAFVTCLSGEKVLFNAMTDANGVAYLFPHSESGEVVVELTSGNTAIKKTATFTAEDRDITVDIEKPVPEKQNLIQLMFVVDATGSMGDEMRYLVSELGDVLKRIVDKNGVRIELGFLFYRDDCDGQDKFFQVDFTDVTDEKSYLEMQNTLKRQTAKGGGDYPEALDEALLKAVNYKWAANATKIIFNVLDAPCHETDTDIKNYSSAVNAAAAKGIRICPIMASGADLLTEYLTRQAAILTGGTFVFITDDSGIGNSHYDPQLPNVVIERLNDLMVRLVNGYYTGTFADPVYWRDAVKAEQNQ